MTGPYGAVTVRNITSHSTAGIGAWTDAEIKRALTEGVSRDGRRFKPPMERQVYYSHMTVVHFTEPTCARLLDHLVGDGEYPWRNCKAERGGGSEIDDQIKFGGCLHRQVSRLVALENAPSIDACLTIRFRKTAAVADQTTG